MHTIRALWQTTVGKKAVMALTGAILFGWLVLHLLGNLLVFYGPVRIDEYGAMLHSRPWLLWPMRMLLLIAVVLHGVAATQLTQLARRARGMSYAARRLQVATLSVRTMRWGGVLLAGFIIFHLLHMTLGAVHPQFITGAVYHNLVTALRVPVVALVYVIGVTTVALHLCHGLVSARRSLGLAGNSAAPLRGRLSTVVAILLWLGFCVIPFAVLAGVLR